MNLALSDEQVFLREAARGALSRYKTLEAAREALAEPGEWSYMISFLPGLKSAGGTEEILRNTIGERVLGLPPEPRLDKGIPFSELRAKEREAVAG